MPKGGRREGAGRPPGRRDNKTIAKELAIKQVTDELLKDMTLDKLKSMPAKDIIRMAMASIAKSGDLAGAANLAKDLLRYEENPKAAEAASPYGSHGLPPDMLADDAAGIDAPGDEPGPTGPILRRDAGGDVLPEPDEPGPAHPIH